MDTVMVNGFGLGDAVNTPIFVHIRTSLDVWTGSAVLCNSSVESWQMRRDGLEPVQPHNPKIYWPHSQGSIHLFEVLLKISQFDKKKGVCSPESLNVGGRGQIIDKYQSLTYRCIITSHHIAECEMYLKFLNVFFKGTVHPKKLNYIISLLPAATFIHLDCSGVGCRIWEI